MLLCLALAEAGLGPDMLKALGLELEFRTGSSRFIEWNYSKYLEIMFEDSGRGCSSPCRARSPQNCRALRHSCRTRLSRREMRLRSCV